MNAPYRKISTPWFALVSLITALAYGPATFGPFVFDDLDNIRGNAILTEFPPDLAWQNPASRWLTSLTFAANYQISGWNTWSYHATNVLLHIGCGWLIALLVRDLLALAPEKTVAPEKTGGEKPAPPSQPLNPAFVVASIWLLHPLSSAAVAYIVQRSEILAACSIVGFLIAIIRDSRSDLRGRPWLWFAAIVFVAGICCKTNTVSALPIAVLMDRLLLSESWGSLIKRRGVLYLVPVVMGGLSLWILLPGLRQGTSGVGFSDEIPTVPIYLATQSQVFWHYLWLCVWPSALSVDNRWPPVESIQSAIPWILATSTVLGFGVLRYRRRRIDGWLTLTLFLLLAPTSTLIPITDIAVDHRMYLGLAPVIGLSLILFNAVESLFFKSVALSPGWRVAIVCAVLCALFLRTYTRAHDWSNGFNLWLTTAKLNPSNPRALQNLTGSAREEGREGDLIAVLEELQFQAKARGETSPAVASRLGEEYLKVGSAQQAEPLLREAVAGLDPNGTIDERQEHAAARINLALVHLQRRELGEAEGHLRAAVSADPKAAYGHAMLGDLMLQRSNYSQAVEHFQRALAIVPDWAQVQSDLAKAEAAGKD